jgi:hypothetical protein
VINVYNIYNRSIKDEMEEKMEKRYMGGGAGFAGAFWFAGWLFTIGFANLVWWKIILGIVVWPYFLGTFIR